MKKLSLKKLKLDVNSELDRSQVKSIFGGYASCLDWTSCKKDSDCANPNCNRCVDAGLESACGT